jgi:hypothetical protein
MTGKINSYKDLIVWQQAMDLAVTTYSLTKAWPKEELYGLTSQIRRSATLFLQTSRKVMVETTEAPISNFSG